MERFRRLKMCLNIKDFVSNEPRAFKNFGDVISQYLGALCLVVRGRHVGGVISWGRHDRKSLIQMRSYKLLNDIPTKQRINEQL